MMSMTLSDIANLNIKSADYRWINSGISKNEAINVKLEERCVFLKNFEKSYFLILISFKRSFQGIFSRLEILIGSV